MFHDTLNRAFLFLTCTGIMIISAEKRFELFDMTGEMPGVKELGSWYQTKLCKSKPKRLLEQQYSSGLNIRECLQNSSSRCILTNKMRILTDEYYDSNRRGLLKRTPLKDRKSRGRGWLIGHPKEIDFELIDKHVFSSKESCFILTKECIQSGVSSAYLLKRISNFPVFEKRSWGSCAIVGLSDDLLLREYGEVIDTHDVVIRMGHLPLLSYKKYVGSRSDIIIYRPEALNRDQSKYRPDDIKAYLCKNPKTAVSSRKKFVTKKYIPSIYCDKSQGKNDFASSLLKQLYASMSPNKKATSGTLYAIRLAFSRLCDRLDIYGISSGGGGTYFEPEAITKAKHGTELDSWLLHYLMKNYEEELRICIYT